LSNVFWKIRSYFLSLFSLLENSPRPRNMKLRPSAISVPAVSIAFLNGVFLT